MASPLEELRVVEVSHGMAGAVAGMILADYGADVVKIEPPAGEASRSESPGFHMWNRGKRSLALDLDQLAEREVLRQLVEVSDVALVALAPAAVERLGLGGDSLPGRHSRLIHCNISGFGRRSRHSGSRAYEGTVTSGTGRLTGLNEITGAAAGQARNRPIFTAAPIASYAASQLAVQAVLAATFEREVTGYGRHVETSLLQGILATLMKEELQPEPPMSGSTLPESVRRGLEMCFMTVECADGRALQMCSRQPHHFRSWMAAIGLADMIESPRFAGAPTGLASTEDVEAMERRIRERMATLRADEWMDVFTSGFDIGADPFLEPDEFLSHPQMVENDRVVTVGDPVLGATRQLGLLVRCTETPGSITTPAPTCDQHGVELRRELERTVLLQQRQTVTSAAPRRAHSQDTRARSKAALPLEGVLVVELAYFVAAPLGTALLAEMGARVIKVEPLAGDPYRQSGDQSIKFTAGKESIALDLKHQAGQEALHRLVLEADVVVHGFRPGVAKRLAFDEPTLRSLNPDLVYLVASSYGSRGPQARRTAFHSTPTALSGAGIKQAGRGNQPVDDSFPDPAGGLAVATAILLGLVARRRHGIGQALETTMLTSAGYVVSEDLVLWEGMPRRRLQDEGQHGLAALYRLYRCHDGWIFLAAVRPEDWRAVCRVLGRPEWIADKRFATRSSRARHDDALSDLLSERMAELSAGEVCRRLEAAGIAVTEVYSGTIEDWLREEGLLEAGYHPVFGAYGRLPRKVDLEARAPHLAPTTVGEHSVAILQELGVSPRAVQEYIAAGVVGTATDSSLAQVSG